MYVCMYVYMYVCVLPDLHFRPRSSTREGGHLVFEGHLSTAVPNGSKVVRSGFCLMRSKLLQVGHFVGGCPQPEGFPVFPLWLT